MLCLGGLLALDITTSTPDALCPPLDEVRAAVQARVGEVRGDYHAKFALVRDEGGRQALELVLRDGERQVLLREIALEGTECQDAAQAIALVLERYFDAVERPATPEPEPVPGPRPEPATHVATSPKPHAAAAPQRARVAPAWLAQGGVAYELKLGLAPLLGVAFFPAPWRLAPSVRVGAEFDLSFFVKQTSEAVREESISASTLQTALSIPLALQFGSWSTWIGPWAQLRVQRAKGESLGNANAAYRVLPGLGGFGRIGWSPAPNWTLAAGVAAGGQLVSASSRLVLQKADGSKNAVLVPEAWFGQAQLTLGLTL